MSYLKRMAVLAVTVVGLLVPASSAMAAPSPGFGEFADCPSKSVNAAISACAKITVSSGSIKLGSKTTPITDPIVLTESLIAPDGNTVVGSFDGGRQLVPGGLVGITGLEYLHWLFPFSLLQLYAVSELAGQPSNPLGEPVVLPLKVKLESALLNNTCRIGSNTNPITLNLITGTTNPPPPNTPITGTFGTFAPDPVLPGVVRFTGFTLVDNEFAVPGANGCDLFGFGLINALVNSQVGLPSPAGNNSAIQNAKIDLAAIEAVYQPDGID